MVGRELVGERGGGEENVENGFGALRVKDYRESSLIFSLSFPFSLTILYPFLLLSSLCILFLPPLLPRQHRRGNLDFLHGRTRRFPRARAPSHIGPRFEIE